jgi:hypothetical protein
MPAPLEMLIARDGDQPCPQLCTSRIEERCLSNQGQETLLRNVFRIRNRARKQPGEAVYSTPMALVEQLKRDRIAS